jgi:phage replication initiation protein
MRTSIDWCEFRTKAEIPAVIEALRAVYQPMGELIVIRQRRKGWNGYTQAADICMGDMPLGMIAYGGESQRGWVHVGLTGKGCEWLLDWDRAAKVFTSLYLAEYKRLDIALTVKDGSVSHQRVLDAYAAGLFKAGGSPPKMTTIESSDPMGGKTAYIGKRGGNKYLRCYEKGLEILKGQASNLNITHLDGVPVLDIYRVEFEWRNATAPIPLDAITNRDFYFAGAYPFTAELVAMDFEPFVQRRERGPQRELELALMNIQHQYGKTLYTAMVQAGGDVSSVWGRIVGSQHNDALVAAGVLLVEPI